MGYYLAPIANNSQVSANGAPLSGGTINTYLAGTATPVATYTDNTGGTPQANPIVLNTQGLPSSPVWMLGGQAVKFVVKDSLGNTIRTLDNLVGIDDVPGASGAGSKADLQRFLGMGSDGTMGFRNRLHNGNFVINQRAVSGAVTLAAGAYGHDRWKAGAAGCTYTFAASGNSTIITISAGSLIQVIEGVNIEGGTYAISNQGSAQARIAVNGAGTSGGYAAATTAAPLLSATATGGLNVSVEFSTGTIDRAQAEAGIYASTFDRRPLSVELALCQRYLPAFGGVGTVDDVGWGGTTSTSAATVGYQFLVEPRIPVTGVVVSSAADFSLTTMTAASTVTAIVFSSSSKRICRLTVTGTATPYAANNPAILLGIAATARILFTGAEL